MDTGLVVFGTSTDIAVGSGDRSGAVVSGKQWAKHVSLYGGRWRHSIVGAGKWQASDGLYAEVPLWCASGPIARWWIDLVCLEASWLQEWEWMLEDSHKRSCWKNSIGVSVPRPWGSGVYVCSKSCWLCLTVVCWLLGCNKVPSWIEPRVRYNILWNWDLILSFKTLFPGGMPMLSYWGFKGQQKCQFQHTHRRYSCAYRQIREISSFRANSAPKYSRSLWRHVQISRHTYKKNTVSFETLSLFGEVSTSWVLKLFSWHATLCNLTHSVHYQ
jgi:hypothetical protein